MTGVSDVNNAQSVDIQIQKDVKNAQNIVVGGKNVVNNDYEGDCKVKTICRIVIHLCLTDMFFFSHTN